MNILIQLGSGKFLSGSFWVWLKHFPFIFLIWALKYEQKERTFTYFQLFTFENIDENNLIKIYSNNLNN